MTQILNVTTTDDGKHQVSDSGGHLVDGPFDTNGEAWAALDRLTDNDASRPDKRRSSKKVLWGKPEHKRKSAKQHKKERVAAKKANQIKADASKATADRTPDACSIFAASYFTFNSCNSFIVESPSVRETASKGGNRSGC